MAITKQIVDSNTGVPMNYHVILTMQIDYNNKVSYATIASYYSRDAFHSGLRPLAQSTSMIPGVPDQGKDVLDWAQELLVQPVDESVSTAQYNARWILSDGAVSDHEPQPPTQETTPAITEGQAKAEPATDAAASGDAAQTA